MAFNNNLPVSFDRAQQVRIFVHALHQMRSATINKPLGQTVMKGIRQAVFNGPCAFAPMKWIVDPVTAKGDVGPGADPGDAETIGLFAMLSSTDLSYHTGESQHHWEGVVTVGPAASSSGYYIYNMGSTAGTTLGMVLRSFIPS